MFDVLSPPMSIALAASCNRKMPAETPALL